MSFNTPQPVRRFKAAYRLQKGEQVWWPKYNRSGQLTSHIIRYIKSDAEMVGCSSKRKRMQVVIDVVDEGYIMLDSDTQFELV